MLIQKLQVTAEENDDVSLDQVSEAEEQVLKITSSDEENNS